VDLGPAAPDRVPASSKPERLESRTPGAAWRRQYRERYEWHGVSPDKRRVISADSGSKRLGPVSDDERSGRVGGPRQRTLLGLTGRLVGGALSSDALLEGGRGACGHRADCAAAVGQPRTHGRPDAASTLTARKVPDKPDIGLRSRGPVSLLRPIFTTLPSRLHSHSRVQQCGYPPEIAQIRRALQERFRRPAAGARWMSAFFSRNACTVNFDRQDEAE
jgi:hypothetical protein